MNKEYLKPENHSKRAWSKVENDVGGSRELEPGEKIRGGRSKKLAEVVLTFDCLVSRIMGRVG